MSMIPYDLQINGQRHQIVCTSDTPLLWVIREYIGLTGTKYGCGMGLCGACTVHINGTSVRSCLTRVQDAVGKRVTTIEGLASELDASIIRAWLEEDVAQCGYCQPGQIMSAAALLAINPNPTDADIDDVMSANLCRCGTYPRIRAAIKTAASRLRGA